MNKEINPLITIALGVLAFLVGSGMGGFVGGVIVLSSLAFFLVGIVGLVSKSSKKKQAKTDDQ